MVSVSAPSIVTPDGVVSGRVVVSDGRVAAVERGPVVDGDGAWIVPGYIDTHVHGGGGGQFNTDSPDEVAAICEFHARHGTTALLATTVSAPVDELEASLRAISEASLRAAPEASLRAVSRASLTSAPEVSAAGALILGAHLEGPFISERRPGAMDPHTFLAPAADVLSLGPPVRMVTLAPELDGALRLVAKLCRHGVVVSLGHSDASYQDASAATRAGARSVTHLFNAMPALHHRRPGLVGAALDLSELNCELIADGIHVEPPVLRLAWRAKGAGGLRLVTDAIQAAGMPDGEYRLGAGHVTVVGGRALIQTADGGESLAGSTLTMDRAVANAVDLMGLSVPDAVALASSAPARLLGLSDRKGALVPGFDADLLVLDANLRVLRTMVAGRWVFPS